ncbi:hypothetical protein MKW94_024670 [Papaver nudicaule]|uniref:CCHC-type domain-containing protein n=1 Tax=Papaver nudicaule TaxID=74823 RepID=A0AA41SIJ8_PAPNU|nr:hypothetical protein [Papaver nudicaule]
MTVKMNEVSKMAFDKVREIIRVEHGEELGEEGSCANVEPLVPDASCINNEVIANDESCASSPAKKTIGDPRISKTKGRQSEKSKSSAEGSSRFKSGIETKKRTRTCKSCGATGHDSRTCKKRKEAQLVKEGVCTVFATATV